MSLMCKSLNINRPPKGINGYRPTTRVCAKSWLCMRRVRREIGVPSPISPSFPQPFSSPWALLRAAHPPLPLPSLPTARVVCSLPRCRRLQLASSIQVSLLVYRIGCGFSWSRCCLLISRLKCEFSWLKVSFVGL